VICIVKRFGQMVLNVILVSPVLLLHMGSHEGRVETHLAKIVQYNSPPCVQTVVIGEVVETVIDSIPPAEQLEISIYLKNPGRLYL